jgi:hypothetical protein
VFSRSYFPACFPLSLIHLMGILPSSSFALAAFAYASSWGMVFPLDSVGLFFHAPTGDDDCFVIVVVVVVVGVFFV